MQLIITDAWMAKTRAIHLSGVKLAIALVLVPALLILSSVVIYHSFFLSGSLLLLSPSAEVIDNREKAQSERFLRQNLDVLARRLGAIQAQVIQLESLGERVSSLAGIKSTLPKSPLGQGGAFVLGHPMSMAELEATLSTLEQRASDRTDAMIVVESQLLERKIRDMMLPTVAPIADAIVGSSFGWRVDPINSHSALHTGLDFQASQGTPILAAAGGVVVTQEYHAAYGNMVEIDHGNDLITRYAHAMKTWVKKGDLIRRSQLIAEVGTTGRSTGPHLHFEVLVNGVPQDPQKFLSAGKVSVAAEVIDLASAASSVAKAEVIRAK